MYLSSEPVMKHLNWNEYLVRVRSFSNIISDLSQAEYLRWRELVLPNDLHVAAKGSGMPIFLKTA